MFICENINSPHSNVVNAVLCFRLNNFVALCHNTSGKWTLVLVFKTQLNI